MVTAERMFGCAGLKNRKKIDHLVGLCYTSQIDRMVNIFEVMP